MVDGPHGITGHHALQHVHGGGQRTRQRVCILSGNRADCSGIINHKVICSCPGEIYIASYI